MQISVTQDDINLGMPGSAGACPIALAAQRLLPDAAVMVGDVLTVTDKNSGVDDYLLPTEAHAFISAFDDDGSAAVEPFAFTAERA